MIGLGLLVGHLVGDYIVQTDWQARNKIGPFLQGWRRGLIGDVACTVHCLLYTAAVWACSFWWMPWWGLVACFAAHWPVDRFRLAGRWMRNVSGQCTFAAPPPKGMAPWSIVVVDNTFNLLTLFAIAFIAGAR